jgi:UDP-N-acetylmuramoyl-L-alanyl-D-glutamate--2,6-diaminopimelate ligase
LKIKLPDQNFSYITDNSVECDADTAFIETTQNAVYLEDAKKHGAHSIIKIGDLRRLFGLDRIQIIGITGTNGKTTTASAIYSLLLDLGFKAALQGTRGFFVNDNSFESKSLTTPSVLTTYKHIYQAVINECDFFIMEVSSHAIVQNRIEGIEFALKILTNITQDHLDFHKTMQEYIAVKNSFFQDESVKLINKDESKAQFNPKNCYTYGIENPATYKLMAYSLNDGLGGILTHFEKVATFTSPLHGFFNLCNLLAAIAAVHILSKKEIEAICDAVENFAGVSGRMEEVHSEPVVIVDFAHTPDGIAQVMHSLQNKELLVVFGAGGDRDKSKRALMGKTVAAGAKKIFITSDNPRFEEPQCIVDDILQGISDHDNVTVDLNRKSAITQALQEQRPDEVVLILGKGDEEYQIIYDKKLPFSDKTVVKEFFKSKK